MTKALGEGKNVDVVYLDFQKAFDRVHHGKLLKRLHDIGIGGSLLNWLDSWLLHRSQRVMINGEFSDWTSVTSGVPQGSVLGPILFLMFIDNLDQDVDGIVSKFADDVKLLGLVRNQTDRELLQSNLNTIAA